MRIAIPIRAQKFCEHFGRCEGFYLCEVDKSHRKVSQGRCLTRPKQRCESLPAWLKSLGVDAVVAGGMGEVARRNLESLGIAVWTGQEGGDPEQVAWQVVTKAVRAHENPCAKLEHRHHHCRE
jgi:predicted Fe-Mo cluster-binding NifX family protein